MKNSLLLSGLLILLCISIPMSSVAEKAKQTRTSKNKDKLKLNTLKIQGNKELPKALYIVPWQEVEKKKGTQYKQKLVLHSLYGDLFDPVSPYKFVKQDH